MEIRTLALDEGPHPDVPALCARLGELCRDGPGRPVTCDVRAVTAPTLATVDALARLALAARRHGTPLRLTGAGPALLALLRLAGLVELLGQAEQGEPAGGVQEGVEADDPAV
ncbi:STAS domain-containing protein [Streptomyces sp. NPDC012794]|uniref:STAS domain-containing protein n=1 Tax=Streptomyces sp. NPDC012794 TaxID=3364850 RepID=UPI003698E9F2